MAVPATKELLMDEIFKEWWVEMAFENWHEWFAVQRFDTLLAMNSSLQTQRAAERAKGPEFETTWLQTVKYKRIYKIGTGETNSNKLCEQNPGY